MTLHTRTKRTVVMTQPSLLWFLSNKFTNVIEDLLVFVVVMLHFFAGRKVEQTLAIQASILALALGSIYLRPVVETVISFSVGASPVTTNHRDSLKDLSPKALLRPYTDSGLGVGVCLFPLVFVPSSSEDDITFSSILAFNVASGALVLISIAGGNYDELYKAPQVIVLREILLSFVLGLVSCWILLPSLDSIIILLVAMSSCLFPIFMRICVYCLRGSFSLAEAIIVSESGVSLLVYCILRTIQSSEYPLSVSDRVVLHQMSCAVGLATVLFFFGYSYFWMLSACRSTKARIVESTCGYSVCHTFLFVGYLLVNLVLSYLWLTLFVSSPIRFLLDYLMTSRSAILLSIYWMILLCFALFIIPPHRLPLVPIVARKYYHILLFLILLPSLFVEAAFVMLCSVIALFVLVTVELGRASHVFGVGWLVNDYMCALIDHRDNGTIYMTHLYLLLGSCFTLWQNPPCSLLGMSGMVTLGIVDTVTACLGTFYGKRKWPGTCKTVEGSFSGMLFGILCSYLLYMQCNDLLQTLDFSTLFVFVSSYLLSTMLEAFTTQIDNLVVPLYHYVILRQLIILVL